MLIQQKPSKEANEFFRHLADALDISESTYNLAVKRYKSFGDWLHRENSTVIHLAPEVYPQGSFALGTVIRPVNDADEYDIDLVCELEVSKSDLSQQQLKALIGQEVKSYVKGNNLKTPESEGKRCWTLHYSDEVSFHMDVLPSIPEDHFVISALWASEVDETRARTAISITDSTRHNYNYIDRDWPSSNPKGYQDWFQERFRVRYEMILNENRERAIQAGVQQVPDQSVKVSLQRAIQILKRHRDIMFANREDSDKKPISIIITTLAARVYDNEADLDVTLQKIASLASTFIENRNGVYWIPNPVNPNENFADKWEHDSGLMVAFFEWIVRVQVDFKTVFQNRVNGSWDLLRNSFGEKVVNESLRKMEVVDPSRRLGSIFSPSVQFDVPYRQKPTWKKSSDLELVRVEGRYRDENSGGWWESFESNAKPIPKECNLHFRAWADHVTGPFSVFWQVVNTGEMAEKANGLRGDIFLAQSAGKGGLDQKEYSLYSGTHMIKCYIVQNEICVGESEEFIVNIE